MRSEAPGKQDAIKRKQSRPSRTLAKAGARAVEEALEAGNLVVQPVYQENDIGRDFYVDLVRGTDVTGHVVSVQVKAGPSFKHRGQYVIPVSDADHALWRESTIPVFGVVFDATDRSLRWVNLSGTVSVDDLRLSPRVKNRFGVECIPVPDDNRLDLNLGGFTDAAFKAVSRSQVPLQSLLSADVTRVLSGLGDTFAVGRSRAEAFIALAALLPCLPPATHLLALRVLIFASRQGDIYWDEGNWVPDPIKTQVAAQLSYSIDGVAALLELIDEDGIARGTEGQHVFHALVLDRQIRAKLSQIIRCQFAPVGSRYWALVIRIALSPSPKATLRNLCRHAPDLAQKENDVHALAGHLEEWGELLLF